MKRLKRTISQAKHRGDKHRVMSLAYGHGTIHAEELDTTRKSRSIRLSNAYQLYIQSPEWLALRSKILAERGRKCQVCGTTEGEMNLHHKHYRNFRHERSKDLLVLCRRCHDIYHAVLRCQ